MATIVASLVLVSLIVLAMAVGVIVNGRELKGSCGGVGGDCACGREGCVKGEAVSSEQ